MRVLLHDKKLASLIELQTVYSINDLYDMLEMLDVHDALQDQAMAEAKKEERRGR